MLLRRAGAPVLALGLLVAPVLVGCGGGSDESPSQLLSRAKTTLDDARSVHFVLGSDNAPATGTALLGGEGDVLRPSSFDGTLKVLTGGNTVDLGVVSVGGTVYVKLPFLGRYSVDVWCRIKRARSSALVMRAFFTR